MSLYLEVNGLFSDQGTNIPSATDDAQCKTLCDANSNCVAYTLGGCNHYLVSTSTLINSYWSPGAINTCLKKSSFVDSEISKPVSNWKWNNWNTLLLCIYCTYILLIFLWLNWSKFKNLFIKIKV